MTSKALSLADRLRKWAEDLPTEVHFGEERTSKRPKRSKMKRKPRNLTQEFNDTAPSFASQTTTNHETSSERREVELIHERPFLRESASKRPRITTNTSPFTRPHSSKTVYGMNRNLRDLTRDEDQGIQILQVDCIRVSQLNVKGALTDEKNWYLKAFIEEHKPDIVLINEFGQTKEVPVYPEIETYKLVTYDLKCAFSGVAMYVQNSLLQSIVMLKTDHDRWMGKTLVL